MVEQRPFAVQRFRNAPWLLVCCNPKALIGCGERFVELPIFPGCCSEHAARKNYFVAVHSLVHAQHEKPAVTYRPQLVVMQAHVQRGQLIRLHLRTRKKTCFKL